jgi:hypothetical protein
MRYKGAKYRIDRNGKRYYLPTMVPAIPLRDSDVFMRPVVGERFDSLAQKFYGDSTLWWVIAKANNLSDGTMVLDSNKKVRIPTNIQEILNSVEKSNS